MLTNGCPGHLRRVRRAHGPRASPKLSAALQSTFEDRFHGPWGRRSCGTIHRGTQSLVKHRHQPSHEPCFHRLHHGPVQGGRQRASIEKIAHQGFSGKEGERHCIARWAYRCSTPKVCAMSYTTHRRQDHLLEPWSTHRARVRQQCRAEKTLQGSQAGDLRSVAEDRKTATQDPEVRAARALVLGLGKRLPRCYDHLCPRCTRGFAMAPM